MVDLLVDPTAVLVVATDDDSADVVRSSLDETADVDVLHAGSVDRVPGVLADRDDVGCVVAFDGPDVTPTRCVERVREVDDNLPVVAVCDEARADRAGELAARHGCRYLPRSATDHLGDAVYDALERYDRRRRADAESSIFRTILSDLPVPVVVKDDLGRFLYLAEAANEDYPPEVVGRTDLEVANPEDDDEMVRESYEDDLAVVESGEAIREKLEHHDTEVYEVWNEVTKVPWRDEDGTIQGVVAFREDVTDRKELEERLAECRGAFESFSRYVRHDVRTPLQIAMGNLEVAREGDETALETVGDALERIEEILEDLETVSVAEYEGSREDGARIDPNQPTTRLVPLVEDVWEVIADDTAELEVDLPADTVVAGDASALRPVLENLLKNAVDHAGPAVTVRVGPLPNGFYVEDDGPGIPDTEREAVLEEGYTTSAEGTGTGLGIVSRTAEAEGWTLGITDGADGGARFEIDDCATVAGVPDLREGAPVDLTETGDVGPVAIEGSATFDPDTDRWTVVANGRNVWRDTHEFHFVSGVATPPVRIQARVASLETVDEYTKAGVTVRSGRDPRAPFGYVGRTGVAEAEVLWRLAEDEHTVSTQYPGAFDRFRVDAADGRVTCYVSRDGDDWHPLDQRAVPLGQPVHLGLLVCSHSADRTATATFSDVTARHLHPDDSG